MSRFCEQHGARGFMSSSRCWNLMSSSNYSCLTNRNIHICCEVLSGLATLYVWLPLAVEYFTNFYFMKLCFIWIRNCKAIEKPADPGAAASEPCRGRWSGGEWYWLSCVNTIAKIVGKSSKVKSIYCVSVSCDQYGFGNALQQSLSFVIYYIAFEEVV